MLEWYATDLREMGFQPGSVVSHHWFPHMRPDDPAITNWRGGYIVRPRVPGTPTQEMFHKAGIGGSRNVIAARLLAAAEGRRRPARVVALARLLAAGFDEANDRFDWEAVDPALWTGLGLHRGDLRTPLISIGPCPQAPVPTHAGAGLGVSALVRYKNITDIGEVLAGPNDKGWWHVQFPADPPDGVKAGRRWFAAAALTVVMEAAPF